jgi:hypothetical protein
VALVLGLPIAKRGPRDRDRGSRLRGERRYGARCRCLSFFSTKAAVRSTAGGREAVVATAGGHPGRGTGDGGLAARRRGGVERGAETPGAERISYSRPRGSLAQEFLKMSSGIESSACPYQLWWLVLVTGVGDWCW